MLFIISGVISLGIATILVLFAFEDSIVFFRSPTEVSQEGFNSEKPFRLGGLVEENSLSKSEGNLIHFNITDLESTITVQYTGIVPTLFREGQGIIAEGNLDNNGVFIASNILAKHDENYMPKEVVDSLKASGKWKGK